MDLLYKHIGENVRAARKKANVTQAKLAEALNLSTSHFSGLECGNKRFTLEQIVSIAQYLNISLSELLAGLIDEKLEIAVPVNDYAYLSTKQAAQKFSYLVRNCSQEEINALLEICRIYVDQISK